MKRAVIVVSTVAILVFAVVVCAALAGFSNEKIRYKMTVTVETPEGVKTGSAVREAGRYTEPRILPEQGGTFYNITKGEAVVVDLGERGVLFVLLGGQREAREVFKILRENKDRSPAPEKLTAAQYPRFIYFKNKEDPKTIESVSPYSERDIPNGHGGTAIAFEKVFGPSVKLASIVVEETIDTEIELLNNWLPWLSERRKQPGTIGGNPVTPFEDPTNTWVTTAEFKK